MAAGPLGIGICTVLLPSVLRSSLKFYVLIKCAQHWLMEVDEAAQPLSVNFRGGASVEDRVAVGPRPRGWEHAPSF